MPLDQTWLKTALQITGDFETSGDPWAAVTGDFDGQGISCGVLQWNIGQGSLQPLVKAGGQDVVLNYMPAYGGQLWDACNSPVSQGLAIVRSCQTAGRIEPGVLAELQAFFGSPEMIEAQVAQATNVGQHAYELATKWAGDLRAAPGPTLHEFCWFFDLVTQNGGLKNLWLQDVNNFVAANAPDNVDDVICDWLMNVPSGMHGWKDGRRNAELWRNNVQPEHLDLFVLGYLRALKSRPEYQVIVANRRGTVANTRGYVNGELEDLQELRGETKMADELYEVTADGLNVRDQPSLRGSVRTVLRMGTKVPRLDISGDDYWYKVRSPSGIVGWASHKFLMRVTDDPVVESEYPWLAIARRELGQKEFPGNNENPRIREYLHSTTLGAPYWNKDETPWCSAFVNWCVEKAGYEGTDSAQAISWNNWGVALDEPCTGCIAVLSRHVGFYVGESDDSSRIKLLGGNQHDSVNVSAFSKEDVLGYRLPG